MCAALINPVTGKETVLHPAPPPRELTDEHQFYRLLLNRGLDKKLSASLSAFFGYPGKPLGVGSFAAVVADTENPERILKFSNDKMDGTTAAYVMLEQKKGEFKHLVRIFNVWLLKFINADEKRPDTLWIIQAERLNMLTQVARSHRWAFKLGDALNDAFDLVLRDWQQAVLQHEDRSILSPEERTGMLQAMQYYAKTLTEMAKEGDYGSEYNVAVKTGLSQALGAAKELIRHRVPIVDLHPGNWGFRRTDLAELVISDFGLSSLAAPAWGQADAGMKKLYPPEARKLRRRRVDSRQLALFNPKSHSYVEVTLQTPSGKRRSWAEVFRSGKLVVYRCLDREGIRTGEVFVAKPGEAIERPAQMSLKYGTFEVVENPLPFKVAWKVDGRWNSNVFSSLREAKDFFERVRHWPGSSYHQIVDTKSGAVLVAANPMPSARKATSRRGWWVTPRGALLEVEEDAEGYGHVDFLIGNLNEFGFTQKEIKDEEAGSEWYLEVAMRRGAIRLMAGPDQRGRWAWGAEIFSFGPLGHRRVFAALAEAGAKPGESVRVYDWKTSKETILEMES